MAGPLTIVHRQGSYRWSLDDHPLSGGDVVQLCCAGGWLTGRFEWHGTVERPPTLHFSIELAGGGVDERTLDLPNLALLRRYE